MFGRKKTEEKPSRERKARGNLPLLGYEVAEDEDGDGDLERELSALVGGGGGTKGGAKPKKQVSPSQLNAMVADCMRDFDDDEELSDTDDPELLAELEGFDDDEEETSGRMEVGVSHSFTQTIRERLALYREAEAVALRGEAEAFALEAKAQAESKQMNMKAEAWKEYKEAALVDMMLKVRTSYSFTLY